MNSYRLARAALARAPGMMLAPLLIVGMAASVQGQGVNEAGMEILTRGPMHEAFAQAGMTGATAGVIITQAPPDPVTELPPDQMPDGDNVAWIPGYWGWDDDRSDFIWVSGVWRDIPPGRQLVPGYWTPVSGGWQWISGFWADVAQNEITYLPPPPESLEAGPSSPSPGPDYVPAPGNWVWQQTRYAWQPGYWVAPQPNWVWTPAYYSWTPRGHVYVPGCWDHDFAHRGVMFAPVYYAQPVYRRPDYYYSPAVVIDLGVIAMSLFVRPQTRHYYYGDYYDSRYESRGYYPWYSRRDDRHGYDPLYQHYRSRELLRNSNWDSYIDEQYRYRRENVLARPAQTLALQVNIINTQGGDRSRDLIIGRSLADAARSDTLPVRFKSVDMDERRQLQTRGKKVSAFQTERRSLETGPANDRKPDRGADTARPIKMQMPDSPIAARATGNGRGVRTPPPPPDRPISKVSAPRKQPRQGAVKSESQKPEATPGTVSPTRDAPDPAVRERREEPAKQTRQESAPKKNETAPKRENVKRDAPGPAVGGQRQEPAKQTAPESRPRKVDAAPQLVNTKRDAPNPDKNNRAQEPATRSAPEAKPQKVEAAPKRAESQKAASEPEAKKKAVPRVKIPGVREGNSRGAAGRADRTRR